VYLPDTIENARVLVTVKTYPRPSGKYGELVCTAGLLNGEKWIRIYPVPIELMLIENDRALPKFSWIRLNLKRRHSDFRPESYSPLRGIDEPFAIDGHIGTDAAWAGRRVHVEREVFDSMADLISLAKAHPPRSLATLKPREIIDLVINPTTPYWREGWLAQNQQGSMLEVTDRGTVHQRRLIPKLPYNYSFKFLSQGDTHPRTLLVEDWEIGALYWNCLRHTGGDSEAANRLVRQKYLTELCSKGDILFFMGTTQAHHWKSRNPFLIIGVFYPPKKAQMQLL
jgi:hypothetical protein